MPNSQAEGKLNSPAVTRSERVAVLQTLNQYKPTKHIPVVQGKLIYNL